MPAFADTIHRPLLARLVAAFCLSTVALMSSCGGGGGGEESAVGGEVVGGDPPPAVTWGAVNTLDPNTVFDFNATAGGAGSADGGTSGGIDGEGVGVAGGPGKTKQVRISVARVADGASLGQALTGANTGLARVKAVAGTAPVAITLQGTPTGTYYDAGRDTMIPIGADQELHALALDFDRHLGVTTLTEAAYRYALNHFLQDPAAVRAGSVPLKRTATAEELARLTTAQIQQANEAIRSEINRVLPARYALESIATLPTPVDNTSPAGSIVDNVYGRMQAVVDGLSLAAARFNPTLTSPALAINAQLADDLSDGAIDGRSLDGAAVFASAIAAAYDPASLASLLAAAADAQFARFGNGGGTQPPAAPVITRQPFSAVITQGSTASLSVVATGSLLEYQWFANGAAVSGATQPVLTTSTGGQYFVRVSNSVGTVDSTTVSVTVTGTPPAVPPVITTQPASVSLPAGSSATFTVVATGTNLRYQWFNAAGNPLPGQTTASFSTPTAGGYYVVVTNEAGFVQSRTATLTLIATPTITTQPQSVTIAVGQTATLSVVATGAAPLSYQWRNAAGNIAGATSSSYTTGAAGPYSVVVSNAAGSVTSGTATVTVATPPAITTQPRSATINSGQTTTLSVVATGTAPLAYQWRNAAGNIPGATAPSYTTGVAGTYSVVVSNVVGSITSSIVTVTVIEPPAITTQPRSVTINSGQRTTLTVVATGGGTLTYQWRNAGGNIGGATSASYSTGTAGTYTVVVTNAAGSITSSAATVTVIIPPSITSQPRSVTINSGQTATLSVGVSGTAPFTYQWQRSNANISGATSATYTTGTAGTYRVLVTNPAGTVTSNSATVTVR